MLSLKNIGQRLLDSTTLDEKIGGAFNNAKKTGISWGQKLKQNVTEPFQSRQTEQGYKPSVQLRAAASTQDFLTNKLPQVPLIGRLTEAPIKVAEGVGKIARYAIDRPGQDAEAYNSRSQADSLRTQAKIALQKGDINTSRRLSNQAYDLGQSSANKQMGYGQDALKTGIQTATGAVRTGLQALGMKALGGMTPTQLGWAVGVPTAIGGVVGTAMGDNPIRATLNAAGDVPKFAGLNMVTGPVIDPLTRAAGRAGGPIGQILGRATAGGLLNVVEDELYNYLAEGRKTNPSERLVSFGIGASFNAVQAGTQLRTVKKAWQEAINTANPSKLYQVDPDITLFKSKQATGTPEDIAYREGFIKNTTKEKYQSLQTANKPTFRQNTIGMLTRIANVDQNVISKMSTENIIEELQRQSKKQTPVRYDSTIDTPKLSVEPTYAKPSTIEGSNSGTLKQVEETSRVMRGEISRLRKALEEAPIMEKTAIRMKLLNAKSKYADLQNLTSQLKSGTERLAQEQGKTTIKPLSVEPTGGIGDIKDVKARLLNVAILEPDKIAIQNAKTVEELAPYLRKLDGGSMAKFFNSGAGQSKPLSVEPVGGKDLSESQIALKDWKPTKGGYKLGEIEVKDTNFYPKEKYLAKDYKDSHSYQYWVKRLKEGGELTPIIVEPADSFNGYFIRDGIHRAAAAEEAGITKIPALIMDGSDKKLVRDFTNFTPEELKSLTTSNKPSTNRTPSGLIHEQSPSPLGGKVVAQGGLSDVKPTIKGVTKSQVQEPSPKLALSQETTQMPGTETLSSPKLALPQGDYTLKQPVGKTTSEYNIGRIKTTNQKAVSDAIKQEAPAFEKVLGEKLTHKEIIDQANEFSDTVLQTIGRKTTEELGAAQLRNRQNIARLADSGEVTPELLTAMKTDSSFARSTAQLLGQRAIDANPQTPLGKNLMKYVKAANEVADNIDLVYEKSKGVDFNNKEAASAFYRQFVKPTIGDWLDKVRYSSMLSSPNTVINNASSNLQGTGLLAPIEKTVTGGIDAIVSGLTGSQRKNFAGEGVEYAKGYFSSLKPALQNFADAMKGGSDASEMFDVPLTQPGTGARTAENALAFFPRLAQATDELFSTMTRSGLEKANTYKTAKGGVSQTADQMALETKRRLFNQPFGTDQSYVLNMLEYIPSKVMEATHSKNPFMKWTAKFIFPFVRIPANVFKAGVEYSPLGFSTLPGANNKTEQASKALMGTAVALGAWSLANSDRLTFGMPTSEKQRDAFTAAGLQPYSVKIGDKWIGYTKFHPIIGFNMALASAFKEALDKKTVSDDQLDTVVTVAGKWLTYFANQSYVKQMGDFMSLSAGNESAIGKAIGNYPSQLIPYRAFMGWLARAFDPNERKIDPDGSKLDKSLQSIMMSIPGLRNTLQPRLDSNGQPVKQQNRFLNLVSPGKVTSEVPQQKFVYDTIKAKSLQTSKDNAIKDQLRKSANGEVAQLGADRYAWFDPDKAEVVTVDISKPIEEPKFTGQTEVDKKLVSAYKGKITSRINDIVKLVEAGKIEPAKAEEMIKTLKATQSKLSGGKKPKKITIKATKAPRVSFKLAKPTKMSVIKAPTSKRARISFKNYKPAKIKV